MMMRKAGALQFSIYLCFLILLAGCNGCDDTEPCDPPSFPPPLPLPSDVLTARIYFDATVSMQGFVIPDPWSHYTRILPYLESVVLSGWTDGKADFFRFGTQVEPIDRDAYLQVAALEFYDDRDINQETLIQKVIDYENEQATDFDEADSLVVIVTDLFQAQNDVNLLVAQLKEKYLRKDLAVGLLGVRSQFYGVIYDIGLGLDPMPYQVDIENPETFRPFYLLVLGQYANVARYFDRLTASGFPEAETVVFSRHLVNSLVPPDGASIGQIENLVLVESLVRPSDARLRQFRTLTNADVAQFSATLKYTPLPHAMSFDSNVLESVVIAKHCSADQTTDSPAAQQCLEVSSELLTNELTLNVSIAARDLPEGIYHYQVTLSPKTERYQPPVWCSDWDMGLDFDGSKTLNLGSFVATLSQSTAQVHQPKVAQIHFYIQKK